MTPVSPFTRALVGATTAIAIAVSGLTALAPGASAAPSATAGLYGASDPTYDGVFRQSLALMGLAATGNQPAGAAITWLLDEQCGNGSFQAYRADLTKPCDPVDTKNFTGPDTNSTAAAVMALVALMERNSLSSATLAKVTSAAAKADNWLVKQQNADGGWPYLTGAESDANSTGLSLAATLSMAGSHRDASYQKASRYLGRLSSTCAAGGGYAFQSGGPANASATAQGLLGLVGPLPVRGPRRLAVAAPCANTAKAKGISYLAHSLVPTGTLTSALGSDPDYSNTAAAILGLVAAGQGRQAVAKATSALKAAAPAYTTHSGSADPGALGLLLMVSEATGSTPTSFGGVNLVSTLTGSIRK